MKMETYTLCNIEEKIRTLNSMIRNNLRKSYGFTDEKPEHTFESICLDLENMTVEEVKIFINDDEIVKNYDFDDAEVVEDYIVSTINDIYGVIIQPNNIKVMKEEKTIKFSIEKILYSISLPIRCSTYNEEDFCPADGDVLLETLKQMKEKVKNNCIIDIENIESFLFDNSELSINDWDNIICDKTGEESILFEYLYNVKHKNHEQISSICNYIESEFDSWTAFFNRIQFNIENDLDYYCDMYSKLLLNAEYEYNKVKQMVYELNNENI